jgi:hypothetical protein
MTTQQAMEAMFTRLCQEYKKPGSNGWIHRDEIIDELRIPRSLFHDAYQQLRINCNSYIETDPETLMMRLTAQARSYCDSGINPFKT